MKIIPAAGGRKGRLCLVTGGASSGKSACAERLAVSLCEEAPEAGRLYYVATMHHDRGDEETERRIRRHRSLRHGKGFRTIEMERDILRLSGIAGHGDVLLLEDLSNLLANEMFPPDIQKPRPEDGGVALWEGGETACRKISRSIMALQDTGVSIVAVGSRITEDVPRDLEEGTKSYVRSFQELMQELARRADEVTEVVCGIPVRIANGITEEGTR